MTTSEFTRQAIQESGASGKSPISLIGGTQLLNLLFEYQIGVNSKEHKIYELNYDDLPEPPSVTAPVISSYGEKIIGEVPVIYPLQIFARYRGNTVDATLFQTGQVKIYDELYNSVSAAGQAVTEWKSCNGWRFWFFINPKDGKEYVLDVLRSNDSNARGDF